MGLFGGLPTPCAGLFRSSEDARLPDFLCIPSRYYGWLFRYWRWAKCERSYSDAVSLTILARPAIGALRDRTPNARSSVETVLRMVCSERPRAAAMSVVDIPSQSMVRTSRSLRDKAARIGSPYTARNPMADRSAPRQCAPDAWSHPVAIRLHARGQRSHWQYEA
jgi:hypothetical protein